MDNIAHGLAGALLGYAGFRQRGGRAALWTCIAAAEFPDIDIVMLVQGGETYLRTHRGVTHSFVMLPAWAMLLAGAIWLIAGRRHFGVLLCAAVAGLMSHLLMDWITNYGTMLFSPVVDRRFQLSWVFIVDPYVWAMLGVGLWAAIRTQRTRVAWAGIVVVCAYFLFCGVSRAVALHRASAAGHIDAFPLPMDPLEWTTVEASGNTIKWRSRGGRTERFTQATGDLVDQAEKTDAVKIFRWFAVFPLTEEFADRNRTIVRYRDLRFRTVLPNGRINEGMFVVALVEFDRAGKLVSSRLTSVSENER
jgi:membrane-bound metal-dependent hydrolase YbcI (DUF457 family)